MIFVTVGTHHQPFDRLVNALAHRSDAVIQYGHSTPPTGPAQAVDFLDFAEMEDHMLRADAVVTHAGVGSILLARKCGHTPIVVARRARFGEHVDDHQLELVQALEPRGQVMVRDVDRIEQVLAQPPARRQRVASGGQGQLHAAVHQALWADRVAVGAAA